MGKTFTTKTFEKALDNLFVDLTPEAMVVKTGKGKKAKVDEDATFANISSNLLYYRGLLDGLDVVADILPDGSDDIVNDKKTEFDALYAYAEENLEDAFGEFTEAYGIESFGIAGDDEEEEDDAETEDDEDAEDDIADVLAELELADLKKVAKAVGVKVTKKDDEDAIIEKLSDTDEDDIESVLIDLGFIEAEEIEAEEEDETVDYSEMSLSELRAECKERGIKYTPKQKADALIALLEEDDEANADEEEDEDEVDEEDAGNDYSELSLGDLRKLCKERGIKYTPKQKADDLIALLEESDEEDTEDEDDEEEVEESELDEVLAELELADLKKVAKAVGVKVTKKDDEDAIIEKLSDTDEDELELALVELGFIESDDEDDEDAEDEEAEDIEEEDDEEVTEEELDEILDEEFEDEILEEEEEKSTKKGKKLPPKKNKKK